MLEQGILPRPDSSGVRALDTAFLKYLESYHVSFCLRPGMTPRTPKQTDGRRKEKRRRRQEKQKEEAAKKAKTADNAETPPPKGSGKGNLEITLEWGK